MQMSEYRNQLIQRLIAEQEAVRRTMMLIREVDESMHHSSTDVDQLEKQHNAMQAQLSQPVAAKKPVGVPTPDVNGLIATSNPRLKKTKMCRHAARGHCALGKKCNFAHHESELIKMDEQQAMMMHQQPQQFQQVPQQHYVAQNVDDAMEVDIELKGTNFGGENLEKAMAKLLGGSPLM